MLAEPNLVPLGKFRDRFTLMLDSRYADGENPLGAPEHITI